MSNYSWSSGGCRAVDRTWGQYAWHPGDILECLLGSILRAGRCVQQPEPETGGSDSSGMRNWLFPLGNSPDHRGAEGEGSRDWVIRESDDHCLWTQDQPL